MLHWRDIKNFEVACPVLSYSGAIFSVYKRTSKKLFMKREELVKLQQSLRAKEKETADRLDECSHYLENCSCPLGNELYDLVCLNENNDHELKCLKQEIDDIISWAYRGIGSLDHY